MLSEKKAFFVVGCVLLGFALALAVWAFYLGDLTPDQRAIVLWILPLASGFASGAFVGSLTVESRGYLPGIVATATGGFAVYLMTALLLVPERKSASGPDSEWITLRFFVDFNNSQDDIRHPNLFYRQEKPSWDVSRHLAFQPSDLYETRIHLPAPGTDYLASYKRLTQNTTYHAGGSLESPSEVCFIRSQKAPTHIPDYALLSCKEYGPCEAHRADPGLAIPCKDKRAHDVQVPLGASVAFAQRPPPAEEDTPFWTAPSLETLEEMTPADRVGYTKFNLTSSHLPELNSAKYYTYLIKVNGIPIYVDALHPNKLREHFDNAAGVNLAFGLENLIFSGKANGVEHIDLILEFFDAESQLLQRIPLSWKYSALRDAQGKEITTANGAIFNWSGTYVAPAKQNKFEVFVFSTKDAKEADRRKRDLDESALKFGGQEVVGVVRPPLGKSAWYGVVLGLMKPSGKIQFTFDVQNALGVCRWALGQQTRKDVRKLIGHDSYRYEMEPRPSGAPKFIACKDL